MKRDKYVGMDVHQSMTVVAVSTRRAAAGRRAGDSRQVRREDGDTA
jgi:hypothetical protein